MSDAIRDAHRRAAKQSPAYRKFEVFRFATDPVNGRPVVDHVELVDNAHGRIVFHDVDKLNRTLGGEVGDAVATLLMDWPATPDMLRDENGEWYVVKTGLGMDTLGVGLKLAIRRWRGDPPSVDDVTP